MVRSPSQSQPSPPANRIDLPDERANPQHLNLENLNLYFSRPAALAPLDKTALRLNAEQDPPP